MGQPDFLAEIVEHKKVEVEKSKKLISEKQLQEEAENTGDYRPFQQKLTQPGPSGLNIIAEIKRASPSKGDIRAELDPASLAKKYEQGGATALSVLTDRQYFKGSFEDLKRAREASTLPVLRKDFLISEYQLYESAVLGADAVLLIVRILSRKQLRDYLTLANQLNMDALVEVNSKEDIEKATWAGATLIGINNRNLTSFETDIKTAMQMASFLTPNQIAVAASGIKTREDIEKNQKIGIYNFLIGESLVRAENPRTFLRTLTKAVRSEK